MPASIPSPIQAVLFDYGQVLSQPPDPAAWQQMLRITGLPEPQFHAAYWTHRTAYDRGTHNGLSYWHATGDHAGISLSEAQIADLITADTALWTQVNQPMVDWALRLQAAGTKTGILSNLGDAMTAGVLATNPWLAGFDFRLWSHTLLLVKPDLAIYQAASQGLRLPPEAILFIDDRLDNVEGACAAGMQAIQYVSQPLFEQELKARGLEELWRTGRVTVPIPKSAL